MTTGQVKRASFLSALMLMPAMVAAQGVGRSETFWPTGSRSGSVLLIERVTPAEMRAGVDFDYQVKLTNLTSSPMNDLVLTEQLPDNFQVDGIDPQPDSNQGGKASWSIARLGGGETKTFRVSGSAGAVGEVSACNTISFSTSACAKTTIVQPALKLEKTAPAEVVICDPIPVKLVITNTGTGAATGVQIKDTLPDGWTTPDGKTSFMVDVGTLRAGESRQATIDLRSSRTGNFTNTADATGEGGLTATASATTVVRQPVLEVTKTGREMIYVGGTVTYDISVTNKGDAPAKNTVLTDVMDASVSFVEATNGGSASGNRVTWNIGTLNPGETKSGSVTVKTSQIKTIRDTATATAFCAEASASAETAVRGIPAILLEVIDTEDPLRSGEQTTYVITVTNQGTADDNNIRIVCKVPDEMDYVSADGPTKVNANGREIVFDPIPSLAPKAKATFRVVTRAVSAADTRFATEMTSEMLTRPVNETESTRIYE